MRMVDFAVFGSVCGRMNTYWRIIGNETALVWIDEPERFAAFVTRGRVLAEFCRAQIRSAGTVSRGCTSGGCGLPRRDALGLAGGALFNRMSRR